MIFFFSVGDIISGRVVLADNSDVPTSLPPGYELIVEVLDTSRADAPAPVLGSSKYSDLATFPIFYQVTYTPHVPPLRSYSLSARITYEHRLQYLNDYRIYVKVEEGSTSSVDIPVRSIP
jgi:uncharacterized lipoprotein YbaY